MPMGMFGGYTPQPAPQIDQTPINVPKPKPGGGMFGGGKTDWASLIQSVIGGYLNGMGAPGGREILGQVHQRQMLAQQQAMMQAQRQADLEDYRTKLGIQAEFKGPDVPDLQERINVLNGIAPDLGAEYARNYARNGGGMGSFGIFTDPATGQQFIKPQLPQIGAEMDDPRKAGGPTPQASGGFPSFGY